jgi:hypothetical protein
VRDATPQAVQSCHALIGWLIPQLDKLRRRFTLGERPELALLEVLELLLLEAAAAGLSRVRACSLPDARDDERFTVIAQRKPWITT